jgi:RNA polymerase sigma-70 factor, ECF subfamily
MSAVRKHRPQDESPFDGDLLARCIEQDPLAFRLFVARYEDLVFAVLSRMVGHPHNVEDMAQETFLKAFRAFPRFRPEGPGRVSTWLLTIATRLAIDARRRRVEVAPIERDVVDPRPTPDILADHARLGDAIDEAADTLTTEQRAAFILAEFHGRSEHELATMLGVSRASIKSRLFRARQRMRAFLDHYRKEDAS